MYIDKFKVRSLEASKYAKGEDNVRYKWRQDEMVLYGDRAKKEKKVNQPRRQDSQRCKIGNSRKEKTRGEGTYMRMGGLRWKA